MDKEALRCAIASSGGGKNPIDEIDAFWPRIELLQQAGRYGPLLSQLFAANDKNNFLALILEVNCAYQFESLGLALTAYLYYPPEEFGFDIAKDHPAIGAWLERMKALPGWKHPYDLMPGYPLGTRGYRNQ